MIIRDTNVVSEPSKPKPDLAVLKWLNPQDPQTLYITTINLAELLTGIELMPASRKRTLLRSALDAQIMPLFEGRILPFDAKKASVFARINANVQAQGATISFADCAIARLPLSHRSTHFRSLPEMCRTLKPQGCRFSTHGNLRIEQKRQIRADLIRFV